MYHIKKVYLVVCEGKSEKTYIQTLNRFLDDNGYNFTLLAKVVNTGHCTEVIKKYKDVRKDNPRGDIVIWVDKDIYTRNEQNDAVRYQNKPKNIPDFFFSIQNFEDFLALHLDEERVQKWHQSCSAHNHLLCPMTENVYLPLVQQHLFPDYSKGELPFEISHKILQTLFKNNHKFIDCKCDFATFIEEKMLESSKAESI